MAMKPDAENEKTAENPMFSTVDASGATRVRTEDPLLAKAENEKTAENPMFSTVDASGATRVRTEDPLLAKSKHFIHFALILQRFRRV